jgi:predicted HTH transcriptional regulator
MLAPPEQLIELTEGFDFEVKSAQGAGGKGEIPKEFWRTYSAFANANGGIVLLGLQEPKPGRFEILGLPDPDKLRRDLWALLGDPTKVSANLLHETDVSEVVLEGRSLLSVRVPRAPRQRLPVYIHGNPMTGTFRRIHDGDHRCSEEEVRRMMAESSDTGRDGLVLEHFGWEDLDLETFSAFQAVFRARKPDHPFATLDDKTLLKSLRGWGTDRERGTSGLTASGLLMFGKWASIQEAFPNYVLDYRELPTDPKEGRVLDRLVTDGLWSGNLYDFYRKVYNKLTADLKVPFRLKGDERQDETPVHEAIREALANSLIHADYSGRRSVLVIKRPGVFEFRNPGRMRVSVAQAIRGGESDCRNPIIQNMFFLTGRGDRLGSGVPTIFQNWKGQHWRHPEIQEDLEPEEQTLLRLRMESLLPEEALAAVAHRFGDRFQELDEVERIALVTVEEENFLTHGRMSQLCELHPHDLSRLLANLVDRGFLESDKRGRGTTYHFPGTGDLASSSHLESRSLHLGPSSLPLEPTSLPLGPSSSQMGSNSLSLAEDLTLWEIASGVRSKGKAPEALVRSTILALCRGRFLTLKELAGLLERNPEGLRNRYMAPMVQERLLERRFPASPNHEQQAYRAILTQE